MKSRIASIDILRALTMFLMIWVNDFWTLTNIPKWLKHASASEDYLGFSDIIFPLFLFIVGLSIPFAINQRKKKGESYFKTAKHILIRSVSLLIIGVFMVNYESANHDRLLIGKFWWCIIMAFAVVLILMDWKRSPISKKWSNYLQVFGVLILIFLSLIYKGGQLGEESMTTQWWGILGLIGWAYLINAFVYLLAKGNLYIIIGVCIAFNVLAILNHTDNLPKLNNYLSYFSTIYTGTIPALTSAGIVAALLLKKLSKHSNKKWILSILLIIGILNIFFGLYTRPFWGISKIQGTPSWLTICTGIGFISFAILYAIADLKKQFNFY